MNDPWDLQAYDFELPHELIAQHPSAQRHDARLLVTHLETSRREHNTVVDLPEQLPSGCILVVNNTRVVPARLVGHKPSGGRVELLLTAPLGGTHEGLAGHLVWTKSNKPLRVGQEISIADHVLARIVAVPAPGQAIVDFVGPDDLSSLLSAHGRLPLPPYIRGGVEQEGDRDRYQCAYAQEPGAIAAPTAGLHLSEQVLTALPSKGIERVDLTLHVGPGTFAPVRTSDLRGHAVASERYEVSERSAELLEQARREGRKIVAVGTTSVRVLETLDRDRGRGPIRPGRGWTDLTILPGHRFGLVDGLLSNFHLPKSSLLVMVSAFAGRERVLAAYRDAVQRGYRFYSYGDATLWL